MDLYAEKSNSYGEVLKSVGAMAPAPANFFGHTFILGFFFNKPFLLDN